MPKVSSAPRPNALPSAPAALPAALPSTLEPPDTSSRFILLRPHELAADPQNTAARPGGASTIDDLVSSLMAVGQLQPVLVHKANDGTWLVIDGMRRVDAAATIESNTGAPFPLACYIADRVGHLDANVAYQDALHANLKRIGYSPMQFALICRDVRQKFNWLLGLHTKRVADFLGCSNAQVTQHEKLLVKPDGMDTLEFSDLQNRVMSGGMGAEAAFYTLTKLKPEKAGAVVKLAEKEYARLPVDASTEGGPSLSVTEPTTIAPRADSAPPLSRVRPVAKAQKRVLTKKALQKAAHVLKAEKVNTRRTPADLLDLIQEVHKLYPDGPIGKFVHFVLHDWIAGKAELGDVINLCTQLNTNANENANANANANVVDLGPKKKPHVHGVRKPILPGAKKVAAKKVVTKKVVAKPLARKLVTRGGKVMQARTQASTQARKKKT